jgi:hypothetical protein
MKIEQGLSNSFGFGGANGSLIFQRRDGQRTPAAVSNKRPRAKAAGALPFL